MPTNTYTPIASTILTTSQAGVTFASIPSTFRDLVIIIDGAASGGTSPSLRFNGDGGSNYANLRLFATPSTTSAQAFTDTYGSMGFMNTEQSSLFIQILDYSVTDKQKVAFGRNGNTDTLRLESTRWTNTARIESVNVRMDGSATYSAGTVISLYGIAG